MSTPAAKRQRVEAASRKLCQPFRSPLKRADSKNSDGLDSSRKRGGVSATRPAFVTSLQPKISSAELGAFVNRTGKDGQDIEDELSCAVSASEQLLRQSNTSTSFASPSQQRVKVKPSTTPLKPSGQRPFVTPIPKIRTLRYQEETPSSLSKDPALANLLRAQRKLESEIRAARTELETFEQARKIQNGRRDQELEGLALKWKMVSRRAAEEVFEGVQARINRMGGLAAWRDMQKRQHEWKDAAFIDGAAGEIDESQRDALCAEYGIDINEVEMSRGESRDTLQGDYDDNQKEDFTMDMMLKSLNIDLTTIGYDKDLQRWVD
ncbi:hypothetical protein L228DRAFT_283254 [Xylona heveae TC161]|uniref:Swi5-dependent recombination DNA repair protein 1 n=1 Tax=Xylona heveae (strain CBS 132557 / TC161) TaxID=1328760 RepID=A0A165GDN8_XYLHT|nr:hypothetical protein L228DRAFT_283254 [Xylona heveae TC161]KZF22065.1 hypothetical protein L228DRAFT_283254 [Xylona heveae TC161]